MRAESKGTLVEELEGIQFQRYALDTISVTTAFNRLKEMEDRLRSCRNRMKALAIKSSNQEKKVEEQERRKMIKSMIQGENERRRRQKTQKSMQAQESMERRKFLVSMSRVQKKMKMSEVQGDQKAERHNIYLAYKRQSKAWEQQIEQNKSKALKEKQKKRLKVKRQEIMGKTRVTGFMEEKRQKTVQKKQGDIMDIGVAIKNRVRAIKRYEKLQSYKHISINQCENPQSPQIRLKTLLHESKCMEETSEFSNMRRKSSMS